MVSSLLIPLAVTIVLLGINLTGCYGNSTYLRQDIILSLLLLVLAILGSWIGVAFKITRNPVQFIYNNFTKSAHCAIKISTACAIAARY